MPRPRAENVERPPCPDGHAGRTSLNGFYGKVAHYRRPRYKCYPDNGAKPHPFTLPLARRQPTADHPHGSDCEHCGHAVGRNEGPVTPRGYVYSAREIAEMLVELGKGASLRKASARLRRETGRTSKDKFGNRRTSRHPQLAINYLASFAPIVIDELLPQAWPRTVILDGTPFLRRTTYEDGAPRQGGPLDFQIYAAYGYTGGKGSGLLWRMDMRGGADNEEWAAFLRSLTTDPEAPPDWVVADNSGAIKTAVAAVWPNATFYACEAHITRLGNEALAKDHIYEKHDLAVLWRQAQWTRENWQAFLDALAASEAKHMMSWLAKKRKLIEHQFEIRLPGKIRSTGALENSLNVAKNVVGDRHFVFRNAARLRLLLGLVTLHAREEDDVRVYANLIRKALLANSGKPAQQPHTINDMKRQPSIGAEAALVQERLADKRARNRKAGQQQEAKESARRRERKIERLVREGRPLPPDVTPPEVTTAAPTQETLGLD